MCTEKKLSSDYIEPERKNQTEPIHRGEKIKLNQFTDGTKIKLKQFTEILISPKPTSSLDIKLLIHQYICIFFTSHGPLHKGTLHHYPLNPNPL